MKRIRTATPIDAFGLVEAFAKVGHPASAAQLAGRLARARDETYEAWVAVDDYVLIGFAAGVHSMEEDAPAAQLIALVLPANGRGSRLGSHL
jgi:uncharacterized membrane protein